MGIMSTKMRQGGTVGGRGGRPLKRHILCGGGVYAMWYQVRINFRKMEK